jgi:hypothetical protein
VGFVVDEVAAGHVSFWQLRISSVIITSPVIRVLSFTEVIKSQQLTASLNGILKEMKAIRTS